jgi:hypothetical protein
MACYNNECCAYDSYSSEEIFSEDLEEGAFYRIWYEKSTYVILKVEKIQ